MDALFISAIFQKGPALVCCRAVINATCRALKSNELRFSLSSEWDLKYALRARYHTICDFMRTAPEPTLERHEYRKIRVSEAKHSYRIRKS